MQLNPTQKIIGKLFYSLLSQLKGKERVGAYKALTLLLTSAEDGYLIANSEADVKTDFFAQCYDVVTGVALSLKMGDDDGLFTGEQGVFSQASVMRSVSEAETSMRRVEALLAPVGTPQPTKQ